MERANYERLRWRCVRRGLLEVDITLTRFLDEQFESLDDGQQLAFVELADMEDYDLWALISGQSDTSDPRLEPLVAMLRKS